MCRHTRYSNISSSKSGINRGIHQQKQTYVSEFAFSLLIALMYSGYEHFSVLISHAKEEYPKKLATLFDRTADYLMSIENSMHKVSFFESN